MFSVYVLYSKQFSKIYIGFTSNLNARLESHNHLATRGYTIKFRPWKLLHSESFTTKSEAIRREKQLKSAQGRVFVRSLIKNPNNSLTML